MSCCIAVAAGEWRREACPLQAWRKLEHSLLERALALLSFKALRMALHYFRSPSELRVVFPRITSESRAQFPRMGGLRRRLPESCLFSVTDAWPLTLSN